jgi:uncharacterized membrane protein YccF (DUF307 family)
MCRKNVQLVGVIRLIAQGLFQIAIFHCQSFDRQAVTAIFITVGMQNLRLLYSCPLTKP